MNKTIKKKKTISILLSLALSLSSIAPIAFADDNTQDAGTGAVTTITVAATAADGDKFIVNDQALTVSSDEAENFGYEDSLTDGVSALDVLVKMHEEKYGDAFTDETATTYFNAPSGWISTVFGVKTGSVGYYVNHGYASSLYNEVSDGEAFELFFYQDTASWSDMYTHIPDFAVLAGKETTLEASAEVYSYESNSMVNTPIVGAELSYVDGLEIKSAIEGTTSDSDGKIRVTFNTPGTYYVTLTRSTENSSPIVPSVTKITVFSKDDVYKAVTQTIKERKLSYNTNQSEWAAMGLARAGISVPNSYYESVMDKVNSGSITKVTDAARTIIALTSMGKKADSSLLEKFSSTDVNSYGITASIYALIALDTANYEIPENDDQEKQNTRNAIISAITDAQDSSGYFAYAPSYPSVDLTAMAVQALAKYKAQENVKECIDKALEYINNNIDTQADGNDNCSMLAQVIVAYTALDEDPTSYVEKMLDYYDGNGQFTYSNAANDLSTTQAYYALVSYYRWANGENSLYDMTDAFYEIKSYDGENCVIYAPFDDTVCVIGAAYTNGVLSDVDPEEKTLVKGDNTITMANYDKIMLWNSVGGMQPLCGAMTK